MRYIVLLGWLTLLAVIANLVYADTQGRVKAAQEITVLVTNEGFLGGGRGSGVLLDATHVLTCAHMAESMDDELFVYSYPLGRVVKARVEYAEAASDLMILVLESSITASTYAYFESHYYDGEPVTIVGNALGAMKWIVSRGVISGTERSYLLTDALVNHGNSGGPWLDDDGSVIAITDWGIASKDNGGINGGISSQAILAMFYRYQRSKHMTSVLESLFGAAS